MDLVSRCTVILPEDRPKAKDIQVSFRSPSENERLWLRHLKRYLEYKEKDLRSFMQVQRSRLNQTIS